MSERVKWTATPGANPPYRIRKPRKPVDPLIREMKRQYRQTKVFEVDKLLAEQTRWLRKRTIAENKLAAVRSKIDVLCKEMAMVTVTAKGGES